MSLPINVEAFTRYLQRQQEQENKPIQNQQVKPGEVPLIQYTIMADCERRYGWMNESGDDRLGRECADGLWYGTHKISRYLDKRLAWWQDDFERANNEMFQKGRYELRLDWGRFNRKGIELAWEVKGELGKRARVFYEKPCEDPTHWHLERREIMDDGLYREAEIVSRPGPKHCVLGLRLAS